MIVTSAKTMQDYEMVMATINLLILSFVVYASKKNSHLNFFKKKLTRQKVKL
jgi:hypothetical protein